MGQIINLVVLVGIVAALYFAVKYYRSYKIKEDVESYMRHHDNYGVSHMKALLVVRGHFLSKELRVAAENWVEEMEEKGK